MLLSGQNLLVCGVANAKSIAWGIAKSLHAEGAQVALTCVKSTRQRVEKLADELGIKNVFTCDVGNDDDIRQAFGQVSDAFGGKLHGLVHSIAYARLEDLGGEFLKVNRDGWRIALET